MDTRGKGERGGREGLVFFIGKTSELLTFVQHPNRMLGSSLIASFLPTHAPERFPKETLGSYPCSSLRTGQEEHVPNSSNHSLYLMKLLSSERNCGGNQL